MPTEPPKCQPGCDCERFPIQRVVVDEKTKQLKLDVIATGVDCKLIRRAD